MSIPPTPPAIRHFTGAPPGTSDAAGFENWRTQVWGSAQVRALGAGLLPKLATEDLYADPGQVAQLQRDCALLREHLDAVVAGVDLSTQHGITVPTNGVVYPGSSRAAFRETLSQHLANIEDAVRRARGDRRRDHHMVTTPPGNTPARRAISHRLHH